MSPGSDEDLAGLSSFAWEVTFALLAASSLVLSLIGCGRGSGSVWDKLYLNWCHFTRWETGWPKTKNLIFSELAASPFFAVDALALLLTGDSSERNKNNSFPIISHVSDTNDDWLNAYERTSVCVVTCLFRGRLPLLSHSCRLWHDEERAAISGLNN